MLISKDFLQIGDHKSKNDKKILSPGKASNFVVFVFNWELL